jgi:hypothetical protein
MTGNLPLALAAMGLIVPNRARAIRDTLGGSLCADDPFPEKPKRMRWKTYRRLMAKERAFARASNLGAMRALGAYWEPGIFD